MPISQIRRLQKLNYIAHQQATLSAHERLTLLESAQNLLDNPYKRAFVFLPKPIIGYADIVCINAQNGIEMQFDYQDMTCGAVEVSFLHTHSHPENQPIRVHTAPANDQLSISDNTTTTLTGHYDAADLSLLLTVLYMHPRIIPSQIGFSDCYQEWPTLGKTRTPWCKTQVSTSINHHIQNDLSWDALRPLLRARLQAGWAVQPQPTQASNRTRP